jgi:phosphatidylglycerol:prolipoprotein diacylglycerol transferase
MNPILFELELLGVSRPVGGYGVLVAAGMLVTSLVAVRAARQARIDAGSVLACSGYTIVGGLGGAWLTFLLVEWARTGSPMAAFQSGGGLVFYGAVPGGLLGAYTGARMLEVPLARMLDSIVPGIAAGHALGRMGCFLGGCCFGSAHGTIEHPGAFSVVFTHALAPAAHPPIPRHPVQLYESAGLLVLAFAFAFVPIKKTDGTRALTYVIAYGLLRFVTESLRGDANRGVWGPLSTSQIVSLFGIGIAAIWIFVRMRTMRSQRDFLAHTR